MLTKEEVARALPANLKGAATDNLVNALNNIAADPLVAEQIRNNFINYTSVMKDGKFKTEDYVSAVTYVSYKLMGYSNLDSYTRTFPNRYQTLLAAGRTGQEIAAYVSAYNRGKLVNLIYEQVLVPTWVLNQDLFQKAINTQAELMLDPTISPKVRSDAANSLMTHLKKPETKEFQISMDVRENSGLNELKETLKELAQTQANLIQSGVETKLIAAAPLVEGEFKEV
jgi:hypothetical protein